ncbi:hypothetical protein ACFLUX_01250 [Chloroflexota bacterium]
MGSVRIWIFRTLVVVGGGIFVYSWFQPWWSAYIVELLLDALYIYPFGFESLIPTEYAWYIAGADTVMPAWFTPFMWVYFGLCLTALLVSLIIGSDKRIGWGKINMSLPTALIGGVGLSYIAVVAAAALTISANAEAFGAPFWGKVYVDLQGRDLVSWVETGPQFSYWLACALGPLLIVLALLRNKIIGKTRPIK